MSSAIRNTAHVMTGDQACDGRTCKHGDIMTTALSSQRWTRSSTEGITDASMPDDQFAHWPPRIRRKKGE